MEFKLYILANNRDNYQYFRVLFAYADDEFCFLIIDIHSQHIFTVVFPLFTGIFQHCGLIKNVFKESMRKIKMLDYRFDDDSP